ncbi:hypothetical protein K474DRAFT_1572835, partial [Panus rudis PR-1116 ss-1]
IFLVSIIPGPHKPSTDEINELLKPLIDDLLKFWNPGVYFARTFKYTKGRLVRCAVVPLVCDLPAARQMSGFASYSSTHFCSFCRLSKNDMDNLNMEQWGMPRCSREEYLSIATQWRDGSLKLRAKLFERHGIRWTELLRLPYWDPTKFVVVDSMHALLLGCIKRHIRELWGMDVKLKEGDPLPHFRNRKAQQEAPGEDEMGNAWYVMRHGTDTELGNLPARIIRELCLQANIAVNGNKNVLVDALKRYFVKRDIVISVPTLPGEKTTNRIPTSGSQQGPHPSTEPHSLSSFAFTFTFPRPYLSSHINDMTNSEGSTDPQSNASGSESSTATSRLTPAPATGRDDATTSAPLGEVVLGKEMLSEVWNDMEELQLPSWIGRLPPSIGSSQHGKLSADQYRVLCTINLVTTTVRLWAHMKESRERDMLNNFMTLVSAITLANSRTLTAPKIQAYADKMHQYLIGARKLYPYAPITPNQHLSLHLPDIMRRFGPVHAWRCFPFERYNGMLQNINTNGKFGELEETLMNRFCMSQNIRVLATATRLHDALAPIGDALNKVWHSDSRGTLLNDILSWSDDTSFVYRNHSPANLSALHRRLLHAHLHPTEHEDGGPNGLLPHRALYQTSVKRFGMSYATSTTAIGDSHIVFEDGVPRARRYGRISSIFIDHISQNQGKDRIYFVVEPFAELTQEDREYDHYRTFSGVGGQLSYDRCEEPLVISSQQVICHFACTRMKVYGIKSNCLHVLPLDRVS